MCKKSMLSLFVVLFCLSGTLWAQMVDLETLNVALDGTATAKNMCYGWVESRAIDGDDTTGYHSCNAAPEEWLEIALDQPYDLREIRLRNRHNCCAERIEGIIVIAMDADRNVIWTSDPVPGSEAGTLSSLHVFSDDGKRLPKVSIIRVEQTANFFVQIMEVEAYLYISPYSAASPSPADDAVDVLRDSDLSWVPGIAADSRNLYMGATFEDVNAATEPTVADLDVNSFDAERFDFGATYFWRVDEVNGTPDKTVHKGNVWSFEVEPYSLPVDGSTILVTASTSSNEDSLPDKLVDGSGLEADGAHAITPETMWFTAAVDMDPWVQFELDAVRKLDTMKVWNSNSSAELAIGWGVKDVEIQYSVDGENWDVLPDANQFSRAPGLPTYKEYDTIDFGGVAAKYVRLAIQSNWGGILMS